MPELSIIVPVYNVEAYLQRCIDSILAQKYQDFELILVNDGSTDASGQIIEAYAACEKRIIALTQENKGVSSARNRGLREASGKYVSFIDADDWIEESMYSILIGRLNESKTDIACCNWIRNYEDGCEELHPVNIDDGLMTNEDFVCHVFDTPRSVGGSIWNKIFIREKISHYFDESVRLCEDNLFLLLYCTEIETAFYVNNSFYHIYERSGSVTRRTDEKSTEILAVRKKLIEIAGKISVKARNVAEGDYLDQCVFYYQAGRGTDIAEGVKNEIRNYSRKHVKSILANDKISWKLKLRYIFG